MRGADLGSLGSVIRERSNSRVEPSMRELDKAQPVRRCPLSVVFLT